MGKELVLQTLRHEPTERVPWIPFAGVHAGKLKGYTGKEILQDGDKLYESLMEVYNLYTPDGMPIMFDLQLEAEVLGCGLLWAELNPPSVDTHPYAEDDVYPTDDLVPKKTDGRIPLALDVMQRMVASVGEKTALYGLLCGPLTLASHLRGSKIFTDMRKRPERAQPFMDFAAKVAKAMCDYYIDAGMAVIAIVDPLVSQISAKYFDQFLSQHYTDLFTHIRERGAGSSFFVCGDATRQIEVMCKTAPDSIHVDENVNLPAAKDICDQYNIALGGNIPLTTTMLFGTQQDNMKCVIDELDAIKNHTNLLLSPGCDMPYDVPVENTIAVVQAALHPDETRKMLENYSAGSSFDLDAIQIPDYANMDKVYVELFTLDPDQCAACGYMVNFVSDIQPELADRVEYVVYRYNIKEDVARTMKMGLTNLPTMCIDGVQKFVSIIPDREEYLAAIAEAEGNKA